MKKSLFFLCIILSLAAYVHAQQVSFDEAQKVANNFFGKTHKSLQGCTQMVVVGGNTLYYIFNADNGYVVIAGDKKSVPVLAYSDVAPFDASTVIPPMQMWLNYYKKQLFALSQATDLPVEEKVARSWEELQNPSKTHKNNTPVVAPLLSSKWGQGKHYNYYCPYDVQAGSNYNNHAVAGCVATAMAQIMYYYRFPETGVGLESYSPSRYDTTLTANFGNTQYNYAAMQDRPDKLNLAASLLTYHCGVAVNMNYGPDGSGASSYMAAYAMREYFRYSKNTKIISMYGANITNWDSILIDNLDRKIPMYYSGHDTIEDVGHAFVCDGYQIDSNNNYYYHFNFGWDGYNDGYFYISPLIEGRYFAYHFGQQVIINGYPDTSLYEYPKPLQVGGTTILTEDVGSFTHGSIFDCPSGMEHTWIIRPDIDTITSISFDITYDLAANDTIFIASANGQINKIITGVSSSYSGTTTAKEITVRLKTTNTIDTSKGFSANYTTKFPTLCVGAKFYDSKQGAFDNGSGAYKYSNFTSCNRLISVKSAKTITLYFSRFETEKDRDILSIYNYKSGELLMELSGKMEDWDSTEFTFDVNELELRFASDERNTFEGWALSYDTDVPAKPSDIAENMNNYRINVFPNPTKDNLYIQTEKIFSNGQIQLFDMYGKLIQITSFQQENTTIDLQNIAVGVYTLKVLDGDKTIRIQKIIKQ